MFPKILQFGKFYPPDIGGIESVMQDICDSINQKGLICDVLCSNSAPLFKHDILATNARIYRTKSYGKLASTSIAPQLINMLRNLIAPYDIIHVHLPDPMANLALFLTNLKAKTIILHWHSDIVKQKNLLKLYAPLQSWLLKRADTIITTTPKYMRESPFLQPYIHKCVSIPLGVRPPQHISIPKNPKQIFTLGRLVSYKGFEYAIRAMKFLPQHTLMIGGNGELFSSLEKLIAQENLQHQVKMLGRLSDGQIAELYAQSSFFLLPSITKNEAFGLVQAEAMSYGLPVISCSIDGSGVDWVNQHRSSGIIVPPRNPQAIANAILEIEASYPHYATRAKARFEEHFVLQAMADSIYNLYLQSHSVAMKNLAGGGIE